eukprot:jgi/Astpho2/896/fgenesh1_pg.00016_%23_98_t
MRPAHGLPGSAFSMAAAPMAQSAAGPLKRKQPQPAAPPAAKRAKTYLLPPVRGQKCGKCKHCLNPQMKKKCLEVERKQKEELAARDELPLSLMGGESMLEAQRRQQLSNRPGSGSMPPAPAPQKAAAMARAQPTAAQIAFQNSLRAVLINDEIHSARVEDFARLMAQQTSNTNSSRKELLLTIVQRSSSPELLAVLVGSGVVDQLHRWLQAARDVQDDKWLASLLAALRHLPMTVDVLGRSSLGKTVNKLTKSLQGPVQEQALALVQQWRAIVSKRPNEGTAGAPPAKKSRAEAAPMAAQVRPGAVESARPVAAAPAGSLTQKLSAEAKEAKDAASAAAQAPVALTDDDMFANKSAAPSRRKLAPITTKSKMKVKMLQPGSPGEGQPVTVQLVVHSSSLDDSMAVHVILAVRPEGSPKQAGKPDGTRPSGVTSRGRGTSSGITRVGGSTRIGGLLSSSLGMGSLGTFSSQLASSNSGLSAAAQRAAAAAASVGDVEPFKPSRQRGERRQTLKVVWRPDRELVAVRRFLQV